MDCPGCGLYNLDHVTHCIKCGMRLQGGPPADFDPNPPRAGLFKWLFNVYYAWKRNSRFRIPDGLDPFTSSRFNWIILRKTWNYSQSYFTVFSLFAPLNFIPGFGSIFVRHKRRAIIYFTLFVLLLLGAFFCYGHDTFGYFMSAVVCLQAMAIFDLFPRTSGGYGKQLAYNLFIILIIYFICYQITVGVCVEEFNRFNNGVRLSSLFKGPIFYGGEVVKIEPQMNYKRGDIVYYRAKMGYYYQDYHDIRGEIAGIDSILALPGESVEVKDKKIYINNQKTPQEIVPMLGHIYVPDMQFRLGDNQYFIVNSYMLIPQNINIQQLKNIVVVNRNKINGQVTEVIFPRWRRREIKLKREK